MRARALVSRCPFAALAALFVAACAGGPAPIDRSGERAVFVLEPGLLPAPDASVAATRTEGPTSDPAASAAADATEASHAYRIQFRLEGPRGGGADGVVTSPYVVVPPAQRATIEILHQRAYVGDVDVAVAGDAVTVDPQVWVVPDGVRLAVCAVSVVGDPSVAALGFDVRRIAGRRPFAVREVRVDGDVSPQVSIELPRVAMTGATGALRVTLGHDTILANLADGTDGTDGVPLRVVVRVDVVEFESDADEAAAALFRPPVGDFDPEALDSVFVGGRAGGSAPAPASAARGDASPWRSLFSDGTDAGTPDESLADVAALARHAGSDGRLRRVRLTARRVPRGAGAGDVGDVLARLEVATVAAAGAGATDLLSESHVRDWHLHDAAGAVVGDPEIGSVRSGLDARFDAAGRLRVRWAACPDIEVFRTYLAGAALGVAAEPPPRGFPIDVPVTVVAERRSSGGGAPERLAFFSLPDGSAAVVDVDETVDRSEPAQARESPGGAPRPADGR